MTTLTTDLRSPTLLAKVLELVSRNNYANQYTLIHL